MPLKMGSDTEDKMDTTNNSTLSDFKGCVSPITTQNLFTAWFTVYLLLLPVFLLVLYIGFNKWKKPQSSASGGLSHSDVFTFNIIAMELIAVIGSCLGLYGFVSGIEKVALAAINVMTLTTTGQILFHTLTCVERYLAVVHPVTYMRLKREGGVTVRNISIALVWVLSVSFSIMLALMKMNVNQTYGLVLILSFMPVVTYCSVCALCVLIRPKPGAAARKQIDQSKRATVYTMIAILGVLLMRLLVAVIFYSVGVTASGKVDLCLMGVAINWFVLPSSLVLPLLFLHRAGKLRCKAGK